MNVDYNIGLQDLDILNFLSIFYLNNAIHLFMHIKDIIVFILLHIKENIKF